MMTSTIKKLLTITSLFFICTIFASATPNTTKKHDQITQLKYQLLNAENRRDGTNPALEKTLQSQHPELIISSLHAIGRIAHSTSITQIKPFLQHQQESIRAAAAFALGQVTGQQAFDLLKDQLTIEKKPIVIKQLLSSIAQIPTLAAEQRIIPYLHHESLAIQNAAAKALTIVYFWDRTHIGKPVIIQKNTAVRLLAMTAHPTTASTAAMALAHSEGLEQKLDNKSYLNAIKKTPVAEAKANLLWQSQHFLSKALINEMAALLQNDNQNIKIQAARALRHLPLADMPMPIIEQALQSDQQIFLATVLQSLATHKEHIITLIPSIQKLIHSSPYPWIQAEALDSLAHIQWNSAEPLLIQRLKHKHPVIRIHAIKKLASKKNSAHLSYYPDILHLKQDAGMLYSTLNTLYNYHTKDIKQNIKSTIKQLAQHPHANIVETVAEVSAHHQWDNILEAAVLRNKDFLDPKYTVFTRYLLYAIGNRKDKKYLPFVTSYLHDERKLILSAAVTAYKNITGQDKSDLLNTATAKIRPVSTPSLQQLEASLHRQYDIHTNRGIVTIETIAAPLSSHSFYESVLSGFYNNFPFHRVEHDYGSSVGSIYSFATSPPALLADEILQESLYGYIGLASHGKNTNTGGGDMWFNRRNNYHLTGHYTVFAKVIGGMEIIESIGVGDYIKTITLRK